MVYHRIFHVLPLLQFVSRDFKSCCCDLEMNLEPRGIDIQVTADPTRMYVRHQTGSRISRVNKGKSEPPSGARTKNGLHVTVTPYVETSVKANTSVKQTSNQYFYSNNVLLGNFFRTKKHNALITIVHYYAS